MASNPPVDTARIHDSFERQSLMTTFGASIAHIGPGTVTIAAPIGDHVRQQHGFAHAGMTFALADSSAGYAALSVMERGKEVVTSQFNIQLLAPAQGARLVATGKVIKAGRRLVIASADVWAEAADGTRTHVATGTGTMVPV